MKGKIRIAYVLIMSLVLTGFGQFPSTVAKASTSEPVASATTELTVTVTPVPTQPAPTPSASQVPGATSKPSSDLPESSSASVLTVPVVPPEPSVSSFWVGSEIYDASESEGVLVHGSFRELEDIYYEGEKLENGVDYKSDVSYLRFSEEFLNNLPFGENEFVLHGYHYTTFEKEVSTITINKVDYKIYATYTPEYPVSETKNFFSSLDFGSNVVEFGMKEIQDIDHIFLDHKEIPFGTYDVNRRIYITDTSNMGGGVLVFRDPALLNLPAGVHFLEVVSNGKSEVLKLIEYGYGRSYLELLEDASKPDYELPSNPPETTKPEVSIEPSALIPPTSSASSSPSPTPSGTPSYSLGPYYSNRPCYSYAPAYSNAPVYSYAPAYSNAPANSVGPDNSVEPINSIEPSYFAAPIKSPMPTYSVAPSYSSAPLKTLDPFYTGEPSTPGPSYIPLFSMDTYVIYNEAISDTLLIKGNYMGMESISYQGEVLKRGIDYTVDVQRLQFSDEFLDALPLGDNTITVFGYFNIMSDDGYTDITITKINDKLLDAYEPEFPATETKNFYTTLDICSDGSMDAIYGMKELKEYDAIYIDHKKAEQTNSYGNSCWIYRQRADKGDAILYFDRPFFYNLSVGVHYIELVSDGHSEVVALVRYDDNQSALDLIKAASKPQVDLKLDVNVTTCLGSSVSQTYTIQQKESNDALDLSKLMIRYYYSKDGNKKQSFSCDNAGISMNKAPYYMVCTNMVNGTFKDRYVDISFNQSYNLEKDSLQLAVRFNQSDWSAYENLEGGQVEIYYDGSLVYNK